MSNSPQCAPKRKKGEQSAEEPEMVRRSARQKSNGKESIMERAMNLKKVYSLELNPSRSSQTSQQGSGPAAQADSAGIANVLQPATGRRMNCSRVTSCCYNSDQAALDGSNHVAEEGPVDLKPLAHGSKSTSTLSSKHSASRSSSPQTNSGSHELLSNKIHTRCSAETRDGLKSKHSASMSSSVPQTNCSSHELLSNKSHTRCSAETRDGLKSKNPRVNNGPKSYHLEKPMCSLNLGPCMTGHSYIEGISSSVQAHPAGNTAALKPASETATRRVNRSSIAVSNRTTIPDAQAGSRGVTKACSSDPNPIVLNSRRISSLSSKDKDSTIPPSTTVAAMVANQVFQKNSIPSVKDKGIIISLPPTTRGIVVSLPPTTPTTCATNIPTQGRRSSSSKAGPKSYTGGTTESNHVPENVDPHENDVPKDKNLNENVAKTTDLSKKSVLPSSQLKPAYYIQCTGSPQFSTSPPVMPLGERCQLCGIDLAFMAKGSDSRSDGLPFSAVLPCGHSYHDTCLRDVFGPVEPPCIRCLEIEALQGI